MSKALTKALELAPSDIEIAIRIYVTAPNTDVDTLRQDKSLGEDDSLLKGKRSMTRTLGKGLSSYQLFRAGLDFLGAVHGFAYIELLLTTN